MKLKLMLLSLVAAFGITSQADTLTWYVTSDYPYTVNFKLYSRSRGHEWPTASTAWLLDDYARKKVTISCIRGEKICYGAWNKGNPSAAVWGVGQNNRGCSSCCQTCGGGPGDTRLTP